MAENFAIKGTSDDSKTHDEIGSSTFLVWRKKLWNVHAKHDHDRSIH